MSSQFTGSGGTEKNTVLQYETYKTIFLFLTYV